MTSLLKELNETVTTLAPEQQNELLRFARFLAFESKQSSATQPKVNSMFGMLERAEADITAEEIKELRREMWKNFPREFVE